jgi:ABC-type transport system involved in multi-copper enzyme maturation permease subunit
VSSMRAEWTKLRTVRGWVIGLAAAPLLTVLVALLAGAGSVQHGKPPVPIGPGGEPVTDSFYFVHRPLTGDGSITVSVSALEERLPPDLRPGVVPWAKAGLIIKQSTRQGSRYAAIVLTAGHGVRMQDDYVNDMAGLPGAMPVTTVRWLRLERAGDAITGYDSADGAHWTKVGAARVAGLGSTAQGGLLVASPPAVSGLGTTGSVATASFGDVRTQGGWGGGAWTGEQVGAESRSFAGYPRDTTGSFTQSDGGFTVTGAGDIAPAVRESLPEGGTVEDLLTGSFAALIAVIVLGALFITAEYRDATIRVTFAAEPRRGRTLAAKAVVLGAAALTAGLIGTAVGIPLGEHLARRNGVYLFPISASAHLRVEVGTAALLALASILALALGTVFRRGAAAVTAVVVAIVLPYILVANPFMPPGAAGWLTRVTPAAAFAVQQTLVPYHQVTSIYTPYDGYYPLTPWAGLAVLAGYAAASLAVAAFVLRRRDA